MTYDAASARPPRVVTIDELRSWHDVVDTQYQTRRTPGGPAQSDPLVGEGLSLRALLTRPEIDAPPTSVTFVSIPNRSGSTTLLDGGDLADPAPFEQGLRPCIQIVGGDADAGLQFVRPLRGPSDVNIADVFQTNSNGALEITVHTTGRLLRPTITPSTRHTTVDDSPGVRFTVTFDQPANTALRYTWTFGDDPTRRSNGAPLRHSFTVKGSMGVYLEVTGADGSIGQASTTITVGKKPKPKPGRDEPGGGTSTSSHAPATGPAKSDGTQVGADPSRTEGQGGAVGRASPTPRLPAGGPSSKPQESAGSSADRVVEGLVISASGVSPTTAGGTPEHATAPASRAPTRPPPPLALWLGVVVPLALLVLGALSETRWWHRRHAVQTHSDE